MVRHQLVAWLHTIAGEVETHYCKATFAQELGQGREEAPLHEALESMADNDGGAWSGSRSGMDETVQTAILVDLQGERRWLVHPPILSVIPMPSLRYQGSATWTIP